MTRAIAYIRVSTKAQDEENQRHAIEEFAQREGYEIVNFYVDKGESRMKPWRQRPGAQEMIRFLESGGKNLVDAVIVFDFTRLGSSMHDIFDLFNKLEKELGLRVVSVHDEWLRMKDERLRELLIALFSWLASMELKLRRERQQAAWDSGKQKGRPKKISDAELLSYAKRYPTLSIRALVAVINADRARKGKPPVSYTTVRTRLRRLGYRKVIARAEE